VIRARCAFVLLLTMGSAARAEPRIQWVPSNGSTHVEVSGLGNADVAPLHDWSAEQWSALFGVQVEKKTAVQMLGVWKVDSATNVLRFTPQFPLTPGVTYRAVFEGKSLPGAAKSPGRITSRFTVPATTGGAATKVTQIFPSAPEVPENLLKFYVHFSAPMRRGRIYEHIHLRDEAGKDVELPFLELDEELWDPEMKRLTLFIDPGRIKREVKPLEDIGPALEQGRRFTLEIDASCRDAAGKPLMQKYAHSFRVGAPDRTPIIPAEWKLAAPATASVVPLSVTFPEPMDHALALRLIQVVREDGSAVEGSATLTDAERRWNFTPAQPWKSGQHYVVAPAVLEDLAGNNIGKAFEVEMVDRGEPRELGRPAKLAFTVK
jgi:hypothetical protein